MAIPFEDEADPEMSAARAVLAAFGHPPHRCRLERPHGAIGFSGALILRVRTQDQTWCLRRWPLEGLRQPRLAALHRFLRHLADSRIAVMAQPCRTGAGESLVEQDGRVWQLEPWLPGEADFHQRATRDRLRSAMSWLAKIHRAAERYDSPASDRRWFFRQSEAPAPACHERLQIIQNWSTARCQSARRWLSSQAPAELRRLGAAVLNGYLQNRRQIEGELRRLQDVPFRLHPCLRDLWHDHLLFTGGQLTGIVDPAAARTENVASDLSRLLGSLFGDDCRRWEEALSLYEQDRPLSVDERRLIAALDRSSVLLSGLTWIDRCLHGQLAAANLPRVLPRLESLCTRLQGLNPETLAGRPGQS